MRRLGCSPLWFDAGNGTVLSVQNLGPTVVSIWKPGGQDPRGGSTGSPSWRSATCLTADVLPAGRRGGAGLTRPHPAGCFHPGLPASARRSAPRWLALAPLVAATGVALGAFRRRGFSDDDSDAIRLRNPTRSRRLTGRRVCVGDHLRPVTGGTYDSRCRRLGSPQSSPEVPAATQEGPAGTGRAGDTAEDRCSGVRPLKVPVRSAVAHRRDPSASLIRPAPSRPERAWPFAVDWRVLLARSRRPVLPDLGTARRSTPSRRTRRAG